MNREYGYLIFQQTHPDPSSWGPSLMRPHRRLWLWLREPATQTDSPGGPNLLQATTSPSLCPLMALPAERRDLQSQSQLPVLLQSFQGDLEARREQWEALPQVCFFLTPTELPPASGCLISVFIFRCYRLELELKLVSPFAPSSSLKGCFSA